MQIKYSLVVKRIRMIIAVSMAFLAGRAEIVFAINIWENVCNV